MEIQRQRENPLDKRFCTSRIPVHQLLLQTTLEFENTEIDTLTYAEKVLPERDRIRLHLSINAIETRGDPLPQGIRMLLRPMLRAWKYVNMT